MPVEIKELVIRATTLPENEEADSTGQAGAGPEEREAIVEECVRQVLRILKQAEER